MNLDLRARRLDCVLGFTISIYKTMLFKGSTSIAVDREFAFNRSTEPTLHWMLVFPFSRLLHHIYPSAGAMQSGESLLGRLTRRETG